MNRLAGQVAIVTGGAQGIGGATSRRLAEEGAKVLIADINMEAAAANVNTISSAGNTAEAFYADVGNHQDIRAMVGKAVDLWGRLDILVNNAYEPDSSRSGSALEISEEQWDRGMAVLVKAVFLGAKYAVPEMQKVGAGSIVNLSSEHGVVMAPRALVYDAGKSAVIGVTRQMATDFGPMGIRVNAVCPGYTITERQAARWKDNPSALQYYANQYPLRRTGRPIDIANAITFLCSEEASFITGVALMVDGGLTVQHQENLGIRQGHYLQDHPETRLPGL
jgi:NAD(P)-dependent dehydrogenase (short-subunit alcohol dehydrogenase family)